MRSGLSRRYWRDRYVVYRLFGDGRLFYIGSTNDLVRRLTEHTGWWTEHVDRLRVQVFPELEVARAAERLAIQEEQPLINVISTGRPANDRSWPGWTDLDHARAEEYRTRYVAGDPTASRQARLERTEAVRRLLRLSTTSGHRAYCQETEKSA